jgi:SSS family solute:Na+ symporter
MTLIDWIIVAVFFGCLLFIAVVTNRMTRSVAGFLSSERLAGRYLLTIAQSMAFIAAIGIIGNFEALYRNGLGGVWWGMMFVPINTILALTGFVIYRYRETRALTMAQFIEVRYSRRLRLFTGFLGFLSGVLNCAVFPMVTANFLIYFLQLPESYTLLGLALPTYHSCMIVMVGFAVIMAISGGQITIMITDFFQGIIVTVAFMASILFMLWFFGWTTLVDTLYASEFLINPAEQELVDRFNRPEGASMLNPFNMEGIQDFGVPFFLMTAFLLVLRHGVWQGGAGYMTAARSPHEAKMGNILGGWRWLLVALGTHALALGAYVLVWNPEFISQRMEIAGIVSAIDDPYRQSQMFVPIVLLELFPPGMVGLFAILMIGASISTDNSAYHSWGSIFLQDVVMPFRKKPFTREQHLKYLRWSIVMIGVIAVIFSSIWTLKDYILMWFQLTGSIYIGGASCAIIGGLYWKKATTQGAWGGLIVGSILSVGGILYRQVWPNATFPWNDQIINGLHIAVFAIIVSYVVFVAVSLLSCEKDYNMDKLLHRGIYKVRGEQKDQLPYRASWIARKLGITEEFSTFDKWIYYGLIIWTVVYSLVFVVGTVYALNYQPGSDYWRGAWAWLIGIKALVAFAAGIWFACGGMRDIVRLVRDLTQVQIDEADDGTVVFSDSLVEDLESETSGE